MALLEYKGLGYPGPRAASVMSRVFTGLKDFYDYQKLALAFLREQKVFRVAWSEGEPPDWAARPTPRGRRGRAISHTENVWVEILEPDGDGEDADALFEPFFDDDAKEVFEVDASESAVGTVQAAQRKPPREQRITILDRDIESNQLLLSRKPERPHLLLWPNDVPLRRQQDAIQKLTDSPRPAHKPLVQLFERLDQVEWPWFIPERLDERDWLVLKDPTRPGTDRQREFVAKALATPDFAVLEGPPGSGKTTAICELVLQLIRRNKRVLLCASTHVAVDNVLERLKDPHQEYAPWTNPLRIGDESKASETVAPYLFKNRRRTDTETMKEFLTARPTAPSRQHLLRCLDDSAVLQRLILESSNVVCGTTIGILQLFRLMREEGAAPPLTSGLSDLFDVLIVDEASKTTFQEFLVPALLARRWVLVGDVRQLSPFVDEDGLHANLAACFPDPAARQACADVFLARPDQPGVRPAHRRQRPVALASDDAHLRSLYRRQAEAQKATCVEVTDASPLALVGASVVLGSTAEFVERLHELPLDLHTIRGGDGRLAGLRGRAAAWGRLADREPEREQAWENQLGYRLVRDYERRFSPSLAAPPDENPSSDRTARAAAEREALMPAWFVPEEQAVLAERIDRVRRVAFPSVLEAIQRGFDAGRARTPTTLTEGMPASRFAERHVLLEYQHRMHPDIAAFPRSRVYGGLALKTDEPAMRASREWTFDAGRRRARWIHVEGRCRGRSSAAEAQVAVREARRFCEWTRNNPHTGDDGAPDGVPWRVAILPFYRAQERELRRRLREWTAQWHRYRRFALGPQERPTVTIDLCTVDRFQGQEADLVILSFANDHATSFLESLNRLNVAVTRARYQLLIIGNRTALGRRRSAGTLLHELAEAADLVPNDLDIGGGRS
jgi:hypothetical protein